MARLAGEHPELPRLHIELHAELAERRGPRGRLIAPGRPAYARVLIAPTSVLETAHSARLRRWALDLLAAAEALERKHQCPPAP